MGMRTVNDPYGDPSVLVDTVFRTSYNAVLNVANNIDYVKKVSNLFDTSDTIVSNLHQRYVSAEGQSEFVLPVSVVSEALVTVFVNGKWKSPSATYTAYGTTLFFNQALTQGDVVDAMIVSSATFDVLQKLKEDAQNIYDNFSLDFVQKSQELEAFVETTEQYKDKAQEWAEAPENTEVEAGQYSAKHHSAKASAQRVLAGQAADIATTAAGTVTFIGANIRKANFDATRAPLPTDDASQGYAAGSRWLWQSQEWVLVNATAGAAVWNEVARYDLASLPATLTTQRSYPLGSIITTRAEGYSYEVVASGGDLITAGGVRLRVVTDGGRVEVKAWGAKADGLTDDAAAIRKAVGSGLPLSWGDNTYRACSELLFSGVSPDWESDGATIFYDPPAPTQRAIHFAMGLNETFRTNGKLHIDANNKAFDGFSATATTVYMNAVKDWPDFVADDLSVTRARRSSLDFVGGNGIVILGGFRRVILNRPVVTNCTMAVGAEVFGAQGIFGITIGRISGTNPISPDYALIQDPYIDYVASDDPAYLNDQDGIRMFSERRRDGVAPDRRQYIVRGGKIKNARNRSIKMQTQNGLIEGVFLEKDQATLNLPNGMTINPDIDWQINGGTTRDITVHYDGASPPEIVRLVSHRVDETFTSGILDGLSGYIKLNALATAPILAYANADSDVPITRHDVKVLNVSLKGPISEVLRLAQRGVSSDRASVENIDAEITTAIFAPTSSSAGTLFAFARNVWNRGASLVPLTINVAAERIVSAQGCTGFIKGSNNFYSGGGQMLRVESIGPVTPRIAAALVPITKDIADGETWDLPRHGLNNGACIMFVSATIDNSASGVIGLGNGARALGVGPSITVGLSTEPASGNIRVWQPSGEGAKIRNMFGSTRTVSVLLFG